jgi:hypothetical protein
MKSFDPFNPVRATNKVTINANIITLSGSSTAGHTANIIINGVTNYTICTVPVDTSLTTAATNWCAANYDFFKLKGFLINSSGAIITITPAHSWDSTNRINATITTATGTLTGTLTGTFKLDGTKAKIWEVTFATASGVIAAPVGLRDKESVRIELKSTTTTALTFATTVDINGGSSSGSVVAGTPYVINAYYDIVTGILTGSSGDVSSIVVSLAGGVSSTIYVDKARTDVYTPVGSETLPYKTIQAAIDAVTVDTAAHVVADTYPQAVYTIDVASGVYTETLTIGKIKNLTFRLHGAYLTGAINYDSGSVGGSADNYYSRLEFIGVAGNRPEKGAAGRLTGAFTGVRTNDSLTYLSFSGMDLQGAIALNTNGTWVVAMHNTMLSARMSCGNSAIALLETTGHTIITGHLAAAADAVTAISLYNVDNCEFDLINISNGVGSRITNCRFNSNITVTGGTLAFDANSYKSAIAQTENFTGATLSFLDNTGANVTPVTRTNNPTIGSNTINGNIAALDAAIGAEADLTIADRTNGLTSNSSILAKIDALDLIIGTDAQMPDSCTIVDHDLSVYQNLDRLNTAINVSTVKTIKKTIGNFGVSDCDFNFAASVGTHEEQSRDLGEIIPAKARLLDVMVVTEAAFTNLGALSTDVGLTTGAGDIIAVGDNTAVDHIMAIPVTSTFMFVPNIAHQHVWVNTEPTNNWDSATPVGKMSVYVTYIDVTNV